jgi:hypothetical protein
MKKISILLIVLSSVAFYSCKENSKEVEPEVVTIDNSADSQEIYEVAEVKAEFNDPKIENLFKQYLKVENALINTDAKYTALESSKLSTMIKEMGVDSDEEILKATNGMAETENIALQREHFEPVSEWMENKLQGALASGTIYKQYCPMAFNNRGASWLSSGKDVLNPYFGDKMLKCGRVEAEITGVQ